MVRQTGHSTIDGPQNPGLLLFGLLLAQEPPKGDTGRDGECDVYALRDPDKVLPLAQRCSPPELTVFF